MPTNKAVGSFLEANAEDKEKQQLKMYLMASTGIEPTTLALLAPHSNQLS